LHALSPALALPLLLLVAFLMGGARPRGGYRRRSAYTGTKARGTASATDATASAVPSPTTAGCNSSSERGAASAVLAYLAAEYRANSSTVRGLSTFETGTRGASGEPPERAGSGEACAP